MSRASGSAVAWLLAALLASVAPLRARNYFVSPAGKDSNPGSLALPFRGFARAVSVLRAGDTLYLRGGVYRETLNLVRGGSAQAPIVVSGYASEPAVLAGSDPVIGPWKRHQGKVWTAAGLTPTADLFIDGQEMSPARWPAVAPGAAMQQGWAVAGAGTGASDLFDASLPDLPLSGASVHIIPGLAWVGYTRTIKEYGDGWLTYADPICRATPAYCPRPGNRYFLYGSLSLLRSPGQWYQDPATLRLYVWCPDGRSPSGHLVEVVGRKVVARDAGFSHVEFRKLYTFCGGIKISGCTGCRVEGVRQRYVQHFMEVQGYSSENPTNSLYAGSHCEWADGSIEGSSGDGLAVSGVAQHVHNMLIHDVCRAGGYAGAIALLGRGQIIDHNTLYDSGRYLINLGNAQGGAVLNNDLYNAGLLTSDVGAIYSYRTDGAGMVIAYNHVHGVASVRGIGIYLDNGDSNYVVHHNLVDDCAWAALELNLPSICNVVCNNTLWNCRHWVWADGAPHSMTATVLANNLYSGTSLLVRDRRRPSQAANAHYLQPPALFAPGGFTLAPGSWAIAGGVAIPPYTDGRCSDVPDQGAFEYGCGPAWTAGCAPNPVPFPYPREDAPPSRLEGGLDGPKGAKHG